MKKTKSEIREGFIRVTSVLSPFNDFSMIEPSVLKNAADRGTRVHHFCELYAKNLLIESVDEDCKPYVESFIGWFDSYVDEVLLIEERLYCETKLITGQIDLVCTLKGSKGIHVVDIKTPQSPGKSWALQTSAYKYLIMQNYPDMMITNRGCIMLSRRGEGAKMVSYTNYEYDIDLYMGALDLYKFFKCEN